MPRVMPAKDPVTGKFLKKGQKPSKTRQRLPPKKAAPKKEAKLKTAPKKGAKPDKPTVKQGAKAKKSKENPWAEALEGAEKPTTKTRRKPSGKDAEDFVSSLKEALRKR